MPAGGLSGVVWVVTLAGAQSNQVSLTVTGSGGSSDLAAIEPESLNLRESGNFRSTGHAVRRDGDGHVS